MNKIKLFKSKAVMSFQKPIYSLSLKKILNSKVLPTINAENLRLIRKKSLNSKQIQREIAKKKQLNPELQNLKKQKIETHIEKIIGDLLKQGRAESVGKQLKKKAGSSYRIFTEDNEDFKNQNKQTSESELPKIPKRHISQVLQMKKRFQTEPPLEITSQYSNDKYYENLRHYRKGVLLVSPISGKQKL